jgi:hypothetical protein
MAKPDDDEFKQRDMRRGYNWIKIRTSLPDDPKYMRLSDLAKVTYFEAYIWAGRSDAGGLILAGDNPAKVDDLAWLLRRTIDELQAGLNELERAGLVDLDDGHATRAKFKNEQGPSMADKRAVWVKNQRDKRALAKGEKPPDGPDPDAEKKENPDDVKELNDEKTEDGLKNHHQSKRVTRMSDESHNGVIYDKTDDDEFNEYGSLILSHWKAKTGKIFEPKGKTLEKYHAMVAELIADGVTINYIDQAIDNEKGIANTPMYLKIAAVNLKNADPQAKAKGSYDSWGQYLSKNKRSNSRRHKPDLGDYVVDKTGEIVVIDDGSEIDGTNDGEVIF